MSRLTTQSIMTTLAALGTSALLAGCGGSTPDSKTPVGGSEVPGAAPGAKGEGGCGAKGDGGCGAKAHDDKAGDNAAATPASAPGDAKTDVKAADAPGATATPTAGATPAKTDVKKPAAAGAKKPAAGAKGDASCGAGTCSAKK
jgi:hypothetical protein